VSQSTKNVRFFTLFQKVNTREQVWQYFSRKPAPISLGSR
jgi:hypothetical protein